MIVLFFWPTDFTILPIELKMVEIVVLSSLKLAENWGLSSNFRILILSPTVLI